MEQNENEVDDFSRLGMGIFRSAQAMNLMMSSNPAKSGLYVAGRFLSDSMGSRFFHGYDVESIRQEFYTFVDACLDDTARMIEQRLADNPHEKEFVALMRDFHAKEVIGFDSPEEQKEWEKRVKTSLDRMIKIQQDKELTELDVNEVDFDSLPKH